MGVFQCWTDSGSPWSLVVCSQHSNLLNQARLSTLKMRDDSVKEIVEEARGRLEELVRDKAKYTTMIKALIVQVCEWKEGNHHVRLQLLC